MIRLGLCCVFLTQPIKFRSTTATYLAKHSDPLSYVSEIALHNAHALEAAIRYCASVGIGAFRINSRFLPVATHPQLGYTPDQLPQPFHEQLAHCRQLARELDIRLSFHPDQFVVLGSVRDEVVEAALCDLRLHGELAAAIGADVINLHGSGSLERLEGNLDRLTPTARERLTLENDDRVRTPSDLLPLCERAGVPFVYDVHHHRCHGDTLTIEEATERALATWNREPLFHLSSPKEGWEGAKPQRHHDFIDPADFPACWRHLDPLTVDIEAKAKEKAVLKLKKELNL